MTTGGSYAGKISSPFSGVALYANNDYCAYNQYFAYSTHSFSLRGCSNNSGTARVDLKIGGTTVGSFYFAGTTPTVQTLSNINHGTGNQEVRLTVTTDTGSWDAYVDYLLIK
ncbi:MAG TPA: carbohydrate-binding protein [Bacillota bacterium]|nr:carbohydrate-binding protein [Bacillota bacterium]